MHRPARVLAPRPSATREGLSRRLRHRRWHPEENIPLLNRERKIDVEESVDDRLLTLAIDALVLVATLTIELIV